LKLTLTKKPPCWVVVNGASYTLEAAIKKGITPTSKRKWDGGKWLVHYTWVNWLVKNARRLNHIVDWHELPTQWQMLAAGGRLAENKTTFVSQDPFKILYLREDAPPQVIKAAYKALAAIHHPDVGGDSQKFIEIDEAYKKLIR